MRGCGSFNLSFRIWAIIDENIFFGSRPKIVPKINFSDAEDQRWLAGFELRTVTLIPETQIFVESAERITCTHAHSRSGASNKEQQCCVSLTKIFGISINNQMLGMYI